MKKQCRLCEKQFNAYNTIENKCYSCKIETSKSKKIFPEFSENKFAKLTEKSRKISRKTNELKAGERILAKNSEDIKKEMLGNEGYVFCEKCKTTNSFSFSVHHIYFRSEGVSSER